MLTELRLIRNYAPIGISECFPRSFRKFIPHPLFLVPYSFVPHPFIPRSSSFIYLFFIPHPFVFYPFVSCPSLLDHHPLFLAPSLVSRLSSLNPCPSFFKATALLGKSTFVRVLDVEALTSRGTVFLVRY